uniref:ATP-dependent RNA helicase n=1 Tax=Ditylenchus dipsaci TaxID=166011 RepID=A0A915ELJ2_9BILA
MENVKAEAASSESSENGGLVSGSESNSGSDYASANSLDLIPIDSLKLKKEIIEVIKADGTLNANAFLENSVKAYAEGGHVMVQADQGKERFRALVLCALNQVVKEEDALQVIVISPFRHDSSEILSDMKKFNSSLGYKIQLCNAGVPIQSDRKSLRQENAQIVIGTPGRVVDCIKQKLINTEKVRLLLVDAAEKLFEGGLKRNSSIFTLLDPEVQYMLLVQKVTPAVELFIKEPNVDALSDLFKQGTRLERVVAVAVVEDSGPIEQKKAKLYFVFTENDDQKEAQLLKLHDIAMQHKSMIICKSSEVADSVAKILADKTLEFFYKPEVWRHCHHLRECPFGDPLSVTLIVHFNLPSNRDFFNKRMKEMRLGPDDKGGIISFIDLRDVSRLFSKCYRCGGPSILPNDLSTSSFL